MNVSCNENEFLKSFTLVKKDENYFYEFSCVLPDFSLLLKLNSSYFPEIKNQTEYFSKSDSNKLNITENQENEENQYNQENLDYINNLDNPTVTNDFYKDEPFKTIFIHQNILIYDNTNLNNSDVNDTNLLNSTSDVQIDLFIPDIDYSKNADKNTLLNYEKLNNKQNLTDNINETNLNSTNTFSLSIYNNINSTFNSSVTKLNQSTFKNNTKNTVYPYDDLTNFFNQITILDYNKTNKKIINGTENPLYLEDVWYKTQNISITKDRKEKINYLLLTEVMCEKNFALAEFVLNYDKFSNSYNYNYKCIGSRKKDLKFKCKKKISNYVSTISGLDNLINIKVHAGPYFKFITSFRFVQEYLEDKTNFFEYSLCQIQIPPGG